MLLLVRAMAMPLLDKKRVVTHFSGIAHGTWCKDSLNLVTILGHDASNIDKPIFVPTLWSTHWYNYHHQYWTKNRSISILIQFLSSILVQVFNLARLILVTFRCVIIRPSPTTLYLLGMRVAMHVVTVPVG